MIKRRRLLLIVCGFIFAAGLALGSGRWLPPVYANVTLVSFTGTFVPPEQKIRLDWETATEFDTVGFFIARRTSTAGPFTRVSPFIPHEGDTVVGATYVFTDGNIVLNQTYYYRLEAINTNQTIDPHGPITVTAAVNTPTPTGTPTSTPTRTSTFTPSPTPTATPTSGEVGDPPTSPSNRTVVTPRVATGETITPRPTSASGSSSPVAFAATPTLTSAPIDSQPAAPAATSVPLAFSAPQAAISALPSPAATNVAQAPAPTLTPTEAAPAVVAPVVVAAEAAPPAAPANSTPGVILILITAAILFLGIAFVILRQARQ